MPDRAVLINEDDQTKFEFDIVAEEVVEIASDITEHPIEEGGNVSDHVEHRPNMLTIEGVVIDPEDRILRKMLYWKDRANKLRFRGQNVLGNLIIQEHRRTHDVSVYDGWRFHTTLQQIETAKPKLREIVKEDPAKPEPTPAEPDPTPAGSNEEKSEVGRFEDAGGQHLNHMDRQGPPMRVEHPALGGAEESYKEKRTELPDMRSL